MEKLMRIGLDTSKSVFQLHGVSEAEEVILRKRLRWHQLLAWFTACEPTRIGLEACGGAHHWGRALRALGHEVVLLPPQYVKPYVARGKNDAADAEAICEAMSRPKVRKRLVAVKTIEQQAAQMLVGTRDQLVRRRTRLSNTIRGYAAEFGLIAPAGLGHVDGLLARLEAEASLPQLAKDLFRLHAADWQQLALQLRQVEAALIAMHRHDALARRLAEIPGIGPIGATMLAIKAGDATRFACARNFAAWIGLTPKDHSTANKRRLGGITRAGDESLRSTLVQGATAVIRQVARGNTRQASPWLLALLKRKPPKLAAVALANKTARIAWKLMVSGERYDRRKALGEHRSADTPIAAADTPARTAA